MTPTEIMDQIIRYEQAELDATETLELFAALVKSGLAWSLQGSYGRTAKRLIENGHLSPEGEILKEFTVDF